MPWNAPKRRATARTRILRKAKPAPVVFVQSMRGPVVQSTGGLGTLSPIASIGFAEVVAIRRPLRRRAKRFSMSQLPFIAGIVLRNTVRAELDDDHQPVTENAEHVAVSARISEKYGAFPVSPRITGDTFDIVIATRLCRSLVGVPIDPSAAPEPRQAKIGLGPAFSVAPFDWLLARIERFRQIWRT